MKILILLMMITGCDQLFGLQEIDPGVDAPIELPCNGIKLYDGTCYFMQCQGYIWTHQQAQDVCSAQDAKLCDVQHVRWAFALGAAECCQAWTDSTCNGGFVVGYPDSSPSTAGGCTNGTNEGCAPETTPEGANCCR